ncbi:DoxX family protein [Symmachiella macrocystis]|uniref:DoxX family protein n=1 Tax=Symmachiella macrocystis TaxID=2527985 RepID=UPI0011B46A37|nr:DoxX family protein [Symmachiella macrocystis]
MNLLHVELQQEVMANLGYPMYLMTILGVAKLLDVAAFFNPYDTGTDSMGKRRIHLRHAWRRGVACMRR